MDHILPWVQAILTTTPTRWLNLTQTLPQELLAQAPAPQQWSALECLLHLIDTERIFCFRLEAFLEGRPEFPAFDPDSQGTKPGADSSPKDLAAEFARLRAESLPALVKITLADLSRQARHQELGPVTLGEMVHEWAAHDLNHTVQAERALMQPFIRGCGPWQPYFTEHLMSQSEP